MSLDKKKVLIGFSGGVDSTASSLLLREKGYEVHGIFFNVFGSESDTQNKATEVARKLSMPLITLDISKEFKKRVKDYFYEEYKQGRTPNPCVQCNKYIKFNFMLQEAKKINAYYISTGHYARILYDDIGDYYVIKKSTALNKDQTYMLYNLNQEILRHTLFPLGNMESKDYVREIVHHVGLPNANTKDSQEICFIQNNDYVDYICRNYDYSPMEGDYVDISGNILGRHRGVVNYTIGQRKGLGITLGKPVYVTHIDAHKNTVVLGNNDELYQDVVYSNKNNFIHIEFNQPMKVEAKVRYSANPTEAILTFEDDNIIKTTFLKPQRAITPGQSIVFYSGDTLLGGGTII